MATGSIATTDIAESNDSLNLIDVVIGVGYAIMLAWHYLVLFSPAYGDINGSGSLGYIFDRQLVLYLSIAFAFGLILLRYRFGKQAPSSAKKTIIVIIATSIFAVVSSALYVMSIAAGVVLGVKLALFACVGASEGILMYLWLRCLVEKSSEMFLRLFATYMISGGLIAILVCCIIWPVSAVLAIISPGVSAIFLIRATTLLESKHPQEPTHQINFQVETNQREHSNANRSDAVSDLLDKLIHRRNILMALSVAIYALIFGLLQGAFVADNVPILISNDAVALFGIVVAGCIICVIPKHFASSASIDMIHRASLIIFVLGAVLVAWFNQGDVFLVCAQIALLAGFNLFDFGVLIYGIHEFSDDSLNTSRSVDRTRPIVYLCLAAGLLLGHFISVATDTSELPMVLLGLSGLSIALLVLTTLMPLYGFDSEENKLVLEQNNSDRCTNCSFFALSSLAILPVTPQTSQLGSDNNEWKSPWRSACDEVTRLYQLSPRETEIFFLLAKGRNAEYIQQQLVISTHTVKTHIANIYRKLEVHSLQELLDLIEETRDNMKTK